MLKNITIMNHINVPAVANSIHLGSNVSKADFAMRNNIMDRFFDMGIFKPFNKRSEIKICYNQE
jgi:hypothetical protein